MARAYIEIDDMEMDLDEYSDYIASGQEGVVHELGFTYDRRHAVPDENGAVI